MIGWVQLAVIITDSSTLFSSLDALTTIPEKIRRPYYFDAAFLAGDGKSVLTIIVTPYLCSVSQKIMKNPSLCPTVFMVDYT
jgi:hypothetical protein